MLAQNVSSSGATSSSAVILWSCVLVVIIVIAFAAVTQVKKRLRDGDEPLTGAAGGFSLSDLRRLHREGQISDDELDKAKRKIVEAAKKSADRELKKPGGGAGLGRT